MMFIEDIHMMFIYVAPQTDRRRRCPARHLLLRLRALLARARGGAAAYADFRDRYRDLARNAWLRGTHRRMPNE